MEIQQYAFSLADTFMSAIGYKDYFAYSTLANHGVESIYCTNPFQIYPSSEEEFSTVPDTASCFEVMKNGLFGEIYKNIDDIPATIKNQYGISMVDGWILPGIWDGHGHIVQYGKMESGVKVFNQDIPTIISTVLAYLELHPTYGSRDKWIDGIGWDQARFGGKMPTAEDLSHPLLDNLYIALARVDVHCIWVSAAVMRLLPDPLPETPPGGSIPSNGVFCDNAMDLVIPFIPPVTKEDIKGFITSAVKQLHKVGLTGVMDAATAHNEISVYKELTEQGQLGFRVYGMLECATRNTFCANKGDLRKTRVVNRNGTFILRAVKLFADGALGSWGAALIEPYDDEPTRGTMLLNETELSKVTAAWYHENWQVNVHAIGDRANRAALNAFEAAMTINSSLNNDRRLRIEHAQIIHPKDQPRLRHLGVIPSIQPTHATSDMAYAATRLGSQRIKNSAYRMLSLFPTASDPDKAPPVFGSDFPVEPAAPLHGMYAAVTRCNPNMDTCNRDEVWDEERVTRLQAVRGFGRNVAHGGWLEKYGVGRIVKGGWADWVVLDQDVLDETVDMRKVVVKETWVGGRRVWSIDS